MMQSNLAMRIDYRKEWAKAHPDKVREAQKRWKQKNKEKIREYRRLWKKNNIEKVRAHKRTWNNNHREDIVKWEKEHPEKIVEAQKKLRSKNPERVAVYSRVQRRIRKQEIIKPSICSLCGNSEVPIEGHHLDYNRPYDLRWLCRDCHKILHRKDEAGKGIRSILESLPDEED